jgi:DNA helicase-2/ATP-dependent DNA helicase PcrA
VSSGFAGAGGSSGERGSITRSGWYERGMPEREASGTHAREPQAAVARFRLGEDVVHAAFGDGVITGVEPGGVIVVRFADDGSERKLMAEYAPVSRR